jgi:orotidine-5'-phosphate decarboxylase
MNAIDRLIQQIKKKNNPSMMGLDPRLENIPAFIREEAYKKYGKNFRGAAEAILVFNKRLIDKTFDLMPAVKPQIAFYEALGEDGLRAFRETCEYAKEKGLLIIGDVKRGDIGATASAYSSAFLGKTKIGDQLQSVYDVDFITVNPYLGTESIKPFLDDCKKYEKGLFILVKTSNKTSGDLQDLLTFGGKFLYEHVAGLVNRWAEDLKGENGYSAVGAVVGATYPEQLTTLRELLKWSYILVPGYGTQGGTATGAAGAFNRDGLGAIVNSSRGIIQAYTSELWKKLYTEEQFDEAARAEVIRMRDELNKEVARKITGH